MNRNNELKKFYMFLLKEEMLKGQLDEESYDQWILDAYLKEKSLSNAYNAKPRCSETIRYKCERTDCHDCDYHY